ncbi:Hypothetical predicted protein [Mytilus galloprovincialis]|uniref:BEN domain-containing protein n=1 Tax=Mytilus galloprovincialis TaxID=29158 RepID=A0A8B6DC89_MYTGA|nr:Hypothetical predicted protein [Mytilus galloprovincialis]
MASTGMFVLIIWVNDDPIKGNVVKVTNIAEPRKAFNEYSVGEKVTAKCPGFRGVHNGVIAMIGSLEEKQQLEDCLKGDQFNQLVKTYVNKDQEERTEKIPDKTSSKTPVVKPVVPVKKRKIQKEKATPKPVEKNLETVARELEVTELHQQLEENRYLPISQVIRESMDILVTDCRPATPERDVCIDCTVLQEQVQSNTNQICGLQNQLQSYNSQLLSTKSQLQSSLNLNQSLQHQLSNLQYYVQIMWSKNQGWFQSSRNDPSTCYRGESSFQQHSNNNQQISTPQPSTPQPSTPQPSTPQSSTTQSSTPQPSTTQLTPQSSTPQSSTPQSTDHHTSLNRVTFATSQNETLDISCIPVSTTPIANSSFIQDTAASSTVAFYNNYTQEILEAKVSKVKNFSKCAKVLLRLLYSDQERQGRSISGVAANSKYEAKPALQHPNRIQVIYDIIIKRWPTVSKKEINGKLAECLKPSASK